jgi:hypothetical protein
MDNATDGVLDDANDVRDDVAYRGITDKQKEYIYDEFIGRLLDSGYSDSAIYRAQWSWIQSETHRMERAQNTKGDADE